MRLSPKILDLRQGLNSGLKPDLQEFESFVWEDGSNVEFTESGPRKMSGWTSFLTPPDTTPVRGMAQFLSNVGQRLFFGNQTDLYFWNAVSVENVGTGFTGNTNGTATSPASIWSMVPFGEWVLATNGVDLPQIYKGTTFEPLGGTPPTSMRIFANIGPYILGFNTNNDIREFVWSHADDPEDWVPTSVNTAGSLIIRELNSGVECVKPLGKALAVYGTDSMVVVSFVGAPFIFGYDTALVSVGALSTESVVPVGRQNYGVTRSGFFVTDGVSTRYIDTPDIRNTFLDEVNLAQRSKIIGYHNEDKTSVVWYYPTTTGEPDKGVVYNYKLNVWSFLDHGRTSALERSVFNNPVTATKDGDIYFENFGVDADGQPMTSFIESKSTPFFREQFSLEDKVKYVEAIKLGMKKFKGRGIQLEVGTQKRLDDAKDFTVNPISRDPSSPIFVNVSGAWITFKIFSDGLGDDWDLRAIIAHGKTIGDVF